MNPGLEAAFAELERAALDLHAEAPLEPVMRLRRCISAAREEAAARVEELEAGLDDCLERLERCVLFSGSAPEYAAIAVREYRELLAKAASDG